MYFYFIIEIILFSEYKSYNVLITLKLRGMTLLKAKCKLTEIWIILWGMTKIKIKYSAQNYLITKRNTGV